jgi:hypothetical protein
MNFILLHINLVEQTTEILQTGSVSFIWVDVLYLKLKLNFIVSKTDHFKSGTWHEILIFINNYKFYFGLVYMVNA